MGSGLQKMAVFMYVVVVVYRTGFVQIPTACKRPEYVDTRKVVLKSLTCYKVVKFV